MKVWLGFFQYHYYPGAYQLSEQLFFGIDTI